MIESDDWGSARLPNIESQREYLKTNHRAANCPYLSYDCLEGDEDLEAIGNILNEFSDHAGRPAKITANYNVTNPDYEKIGDADLQEYFYEPFTASLAREGRSKNGLEKMSELISTGAWIPQSHGREHVNVARWMSALRASVPEITAAFNNRIYGVSLQCAPSIKQSLLASFDCDTNTEFATNAQILESGLKIFQEIFGFYSSTLIPPNYVLAPNILNLIPSHNVRGLQGLNLSKLPSSTAMQAKPRILGREEARNVRSLVRNVQFEPSLGPSVDWVDRALTETKKAFDLKKPAVICSHRINFMGGIDKNNSLRGLKDLKTLLREILNRWPRVEFMSSDELIRLISEAKYDR